MKHMTKFLSLLLVIVLLCGIVPIGAMEADAATGLTLEQLQQKFPHGKYWNHAGNPGPSHNNQDGWTDTPCSVHGGIISGANKNVRTCNGFAPNGTQLAWQCMGYAEKLGYDATGYNPRVNANGWYTNKNVSALDSLKAGDIVRYNNDGHSIYITAVNGETVTYTDCNSDGHCVIRWGATITKSKLRKTFSYVRVAPSEVSHGQDTCHCSESFAGTYTVTTNSNPLTIRSGHGINYGAVGSIPKGATVTVTKASGEGAGNWAHVTYNGVSGYASMEYLSRYVEPQPEPQPDPEPTRDSKIHLWMSDEAMGESVDSVNVGEWLYLCYELYDGNTGDKFDSYNTYQYTAKMTIYGPDGEMEHTYDYHNDNNWIAIRRDTAGKYTGELVFTYDVGGTTTVTVSAHIVAPSYIVSFNANGGTGAPDVQTKYYGIDLTLSHDKPVRDGYTFAGWKGSDGKIYQPGDLYTANENISFRALWEIGCDGGHDYQKQLTDATCTADGLITYTCKHCGDSYTETVPALGHGYAKKITLATCTEDGCSVGTCLRCGEISREIIPATGHDFRDNVCTRCGKQQYVENGVELHISDATAAVEGTVTVDIVLDKNPGFSYLNLLIGYDTDTLELVSVANGAIVDSLTQGKSLIWSQLQNATDTGVLATLTFRVREGASAGRYAITVRAIECCDYDEQEIAVDTSNGVITVSDVVYGDANGDGKINGKDVSRLLKYLAEIDPVTGRSSVEIGTGADCTGDGKVNGKDVSRLLKYLADADPITGESSVELGK